MARPLKEIRHHASEKPEIEAPDLRALVIGQPTQSTEFLVRRLQRWMQVDVAPDPVIPYTLTFADVYDVIVVHRPLEGLDGGVAVCRELRRRNVNTPIVLMVPQGSTSDLVEALEAGADDFMIEPVNSTLLAARIRAFQRRTPYRASPTEAIRDHTVRGPPEPTVGRDI
ncbi:MAG TPA: response regulator [Chloroflexota bacterium]|jgi:DNA-binding response OmpR family regulator